MFNHTEFTHHSEDIDTEQIWLKGTRLGDILIEKGLIHPDQLSVALYEQRRSQDRLSEIIARMGFLSLEQQREALGLSMGTQTLDLTNIQPNPAAIAAVPEALARTFHLFPYQLQHNTLSIASAEPNDLIMLDTFQRRLNPSLEIDVCLAESSAIAWALDQHYGYTLNIDDILREIETGEPVIADVSMQSDYAHPIIRLVDSFLMDAAKQAASDIHFEPEAHFVRVRYRIDGVLRQIRLLHKSIWSAMVVRIKILSNLDLTESRLPQDSAMSTQVLGKPIDFRLSTHPTLHGENIVMRLLDREKGIVPFDQLQLDESTVQSLKHMMAKPSGIILFTGPTGSGKTTTLYSILNELNTPSVNIMTLEDPVEYPLQGIRQTTVNHAIGMTFDRGIRALLRQDPDILLIGEIRDRETADMALKAAMTGHQVYATLHTHSAIGALDRLIDLAISPHILSGHITGIVAQRLIRRLCPKCKQATPATLGEKQCLQQPEQQPLSLFRSLGCPHCHHQGFKGRLAVMEILQVNEQIEHLIQQQASHSTLAQAAQQTGYRPLAKTALTWVLKGETTIHEVARVIDLHAFSWHQVKP